jgi:pSer/pThr/pTyr-binding forkhead associated (FHA) protein
MRCRLISLSGRPDIPLDAAVCLVGRHHTCDVRIDSPRVSRRHCCLTRDGDTVVVRDLGSHNGTFINDVRIESGVLHRGESLTIASLRYRLEFRSDSPDEAATAVETLGLGPGPTSASAR